MFDFFTSREFWAALTAALIGALATLAAVLLGVRKLRDTEMTRLRIKCVIDLIAYRFILVPGAAYSTDAKTTFYAALNGVPGLFGDNSDIMRFLRDFREENGEAKLNPMLQLIRAAATITGIPLSNVSDSDLKRPFSERQITASGVPAHSP